MIFARLWKPAMALLVVASLLWIVHHHGFTSGEASRDAYWRPLFEKAEKDLADANTRADALSEASLSLSLSHEVRYAKALEAVEARSRAANDRIRGLVRELASRPRSCEVPADSGTPAGPDAAPEVIERADRAGGRIAGVGLGCEADAAQLKALQEWIIEQRALMN